MEKLCSFCRNSEILCQSCKKKLDEGKLTQMEVDVAHALNPYEAVKIVDAGKILIMVKPVDARIIIGKGGSGVKKLEEKLGRRVKIVEQSNDRKTLAEDVLRLRVIGVNVLYDKGEKLRIRVSGERRASKVDIEILAKLYGKDVNVVYE